MSRVYLASRVSNKSAKSASMTVPIVSVFILGLVNMTRVEQRERRNSAFFSSISDTLSSTATILVELLVCENNAFSKRLRFRTLPIHPTSKPEPSGGLATALWASVISAPHTVLAGVSEPSGGGLVRGAASRWCFHLLGASPYDPYRIRSLC